MKPYRGLPVSNAIIAMAISFGISKKLPKIVEKLITISLTIVIAISIMIEIFFLKRKYPYVATLRTSFYHRKDYFDDIPELADRIKWLDDNIGRKNYKTTQASSIAELKKDPIQFIYLDSYVRFKREEDCIFYTLTWVGDQDT